MDWKVSEGVVGAALFKTLEEPYNCISGTVSFPKSMVWKSQSCLQDKLLNGLKSREVFLD